MVADKMLLPSQLELGRRRDAVAARLSQEATLARYVKAFQARSSTAAGIGLQAGTRRSWRESHMLGRQAARKPASGVPVARDRTPADQNLVHQHTGASRYRCDTAVQGEQVDGTARLQRLEIYYPRRTESGKAAS